LSGSEYQSPENDEDRREVTQRHVVHEGRRRRPDSSYHQEKNRGDVAGEPKPARRLVRPAGNTDAETKNERQPEIHAKGSGSEITPFGFPPFGVALLTPVNRRGLRWQTVEFSLDLSQLDCPIDFAQRNLLPRG
jgi:hypothetical protein